MNSYTPYIFVFLNTVCVLSAPTQSSFNVYDKLIELSKDDKYKCPYLRETMLLKPEPTFLTTCFIPEVAITSTEFNPTLFSFALCSLYYESFKKLCSVTPELTSEITTSVFSKMVLDSKLGLNKTCNTLQRVGKDINFEMSLSALVVKNHTLCERLCEDKDGATPLCEWSALMLNEVHSEKFPEKPKVLENPSKPQKMNLIPQVDPDSKKAAAEVIPAGNKLNTKPEENPQNAIQNNIKALVAKLDIKPTANASIETKPNFNQTRTTVAKPDIELNESKLNKEEQTEAPSNIMNIQKESDKTETNVNPSKDVDEDITLTENGNNLAAADGNNNENEGNVESVEAGVPTGNADGAKSIKPTQASLDLGENPQETQAQLEKEDTKKSNNIAYDEDEEDDMEYAMIDDVKGKKPVENAKPLEIDEDSGGNPSSYTNQSIEEDDSYFFSYFMMICIVFILGYVGYHNKQKILAMVLEGRRGKRQQRRRPNSANYHKLDSNLEEAVTSSCNKNTTNIIY